MSDPRNSLAADATSMIAAGAPDQPAPRAGSMRDPELWARLEGFRVDDESSQWRFIDRLAAENGWARAYAEDVFDEYLKFVYLMAVASDVRSPSDAIDQAWHLHLAYSESYWQDLCNDILGRRIHHGPSRGGKGELARFQQAYERTLAAYTREFGTSPPARIWPPAELRFRNAPRYRRIDTKRSVVMSWPTLAVGLAGTVAATAVLAGFVAPSLIRGALGTLAIIVGLPVVALAGLWVTQKLGIRGSGRGDGCISSCTGGCGGCGGGCGGN